MKLGEPFQCRANLRFIQLASFLSCHRIGVSQICQDHCYGRHTRLSWIADTGYAFGNRCDLLRYLRSKVGIKVLLDLIRNELAEMAFVELLFLLTILNWRFDDFEYQSLLSTVVFLRLRLIFVADRYSLESCNVTISSPQILKNFVVSYFETFRRQQSVGNVDNGVFRFHSVCGAGFGFVVDGVLR